MLKKFAAGSAAFFVSVLASPAISGHQEASRELLLKRAIDAIALEEEVQIRSGEPAVKRRLDEISMRKPDATQGGHEYIHAIQVLPTRAWALDWNGSIHLSNDGGVTWKENRLDLGIIHSEFLQIEDPEAPSPFPCLSMASPDNVKGFISCGSKILETIDGGDRWKVSKQFPSLAVRTILSCAVKYCWAGGNVGGLYRIALGSTSEWQEQWLPSNEGEFRCIQFLNDKIGKVVTQSGDIYGTSSGGERWEYLSSVNSFQPNGCSFVDQNAGWMVGENGGILKTTDGGRHWTLKPTEGAIYGIPKDATRLNAVTFVDKYVGWAVGLQGLILATEDGGESWRRQRLWGMGSLWGSGDPWLSMYSIYAQNDKVAWVAGNSGNIFATMDGGNLWFPVHGLASEILDAMPTVLGRKSR